MNEGIKFNSRMKIDIKIFMESKRTFLENKDHINN